MVNHFGLTACPVNPHGSSGEMNPSFYLPSVVKSPRRRLATVGECARHREVQNMHGHH